jgi:hypothetical protein
VIALSAHDSGGANQILHWASRYKLDATYFLTGPAKKIASEINLENVFELIEIDRLKSCEFLVASSSFPNPIKLHDIVMSVAAENNLHIVGWLDGWENFEIRWPVQKPLEIWVSDDFAFKLATDTFPRIPIKLVENSYLNFIKEDFAKIQIMGNSEKNKNVTLFLNQPHSSHTEHPNCICRQILYIASNFQYDEILIREHSYTDSRACILHIKQIGIRPNIQRTKKGNSLSKDLSVVTDVFGYPTYALYVAKELGLNCKAFGESEIWPGPRFDFIEFHS